MLSRWTNGQLGGANLQSSVRIRMSVCGANAGGAGLGPERPGTV